MSASCWRVARDYIKCDQKPEAGVLMLVGAVGLTLLLSFAVVVDSGLLSYYVGVAVGVIMTCGAWCGAWHLAVKSEHVRR
mmetsp:Transcript_23481/g.60396  ORF Transcript_23481/g.60396 Transcript_23481/m.60396 type:complete len:80 (+) Transcript_23481:1828-2067(+)